MQQYEEIAPIDPSSGEPPSGDGATNGVESRGGEDDDVEEVPPHGGEKTTTNSKNRDGGDNGRRQEDTEDEDDDRDPPNTNGKIFSLLFTLEKFIRTISHSFSYCIEILSLENLMVWFSF